VTVLRSIDGGSTYTTWGGGSSSDSTGDTIPASQTYYYGSG
jgi:hypothetical protein